MFGSRLVSEGLNVVDWSGICVFSSRVAVSRLGLEPKGPFLERDFGVLHRRVRLPTVASVIDTYSRAPSNL